MSNLMFMQMGLAVAQGWSDFQHAKISARMQKAEQEYRNTMAALSSAQSQNVVTINEINVRDAGIQVGEMQQQQSLADRGSAEVGAAAAGVRGTSVQLIQRDILASAARANKSRLDQLQQQFASFGQERRNIEVHRAYNKDVSVIPKPTAASALLGIGTRMLSIWDSHQTPGETISGRLSR